MPVAGSLSPLAAAAKQALSGGGTTQAARRHLQENFPEVTLGALNLALSRAAKRVAAEQEAAAPVVAAVPAALPKAAPRPLPLPPALLVAAVPAVPKAAPRPLPLPPASVRAAVPSAPKAYPDALGLAATPPVSPGKRKRREQEDRLGTACAAEIVEKDRWAEIWAAEMDREVKRLRGEQNKTRRCTNKIIMPPKLTTLASETPPHLYNPARTLQALFCFYAPHRAEARWRWGFLIFQTLCHPCTPNRS